MSGPVIELVDVLHQLLLQMGAKAKRERTPRVELGRVAVELAGENGLSALAWSALQRPGSVPPTVDAEAARRLKHDRDREVALALSTGFAGLRLMEALRAREIDVIALKGLALRTALYEPCGLVRTPGDIDLMVPREQLDASAEVMKKLGYHPLGKNPVSFYEDHHHMEPYVHSEHPSIIVDVHWTPLAMPHPFALDLESWWSRAVTLEDAPNGVLRLDDHDVALHLSLQLDHDDAYGGKARTLFDLAAWIAHRRVDGRTLSARARALDAAVSVGRAVGLASRVFGVAPPAGLPVDSGPAGLRGSLWRRAVGEALWRRHRGGRLPVWYVQYCARALAEVGNDFAALGAVLRPVLANPRLGGKGFRPSSR